MVKSKSKQRNEPIENSSHTYAGNRLQRLQSKFVIDEYGT